MTSPFRVNEINIFIIHRILYYIIFLNLNFIIKIVNILMVRLGLWLFKNNDFKMYDLKTQLIIWQHRNLTFKIIV
jgi:hypothetical protein